MFPAEALPTLKWLIESFELESARQLLTAIEHRCPAHLTLDQKQILIRMAVDARAWDTAIRWLEPLTKDGRDAQAMQMLALSLHQAGYFKESIALYDHIIHTFPDLDSAPVDKALCLQSAGAWEQAAALMKSVVANPRVSPRTRIIAQYKLGWHLVREGEFEKGMAWNKLGRKIQHWGAYKGLYQAPMLQDGESVEGKTVLVVAEAGRGDEILNFRFTRHLLERGARVIYRNCHADLKEFLRRHSSNIEFLSAGEEPRFYDRWVAAQDLPATLQLKNSEIGHLPYLSVSDSHRQKWQHHFSNSPRKKVGLRWSGAGEVDREQGRNLPESEIARLVEHFPAVDFYSFELPSAHVPHHRIQPLSSYLQSWDDTAAALQQMDFVASSCTALVHMAGAIGAKTWVLNQTVPYYIWAEETRPSSWYKSVTAIKKRSSDWTESFASLREQMSRALHSSLTRTPNVDAIKECHF